MLMAMRQIPEERQQQLWRRIHREAEWAREEKRRAAQVAEGQSTAVKAERAEDVATGSTQDARATPADAKPPPSAIWPNGKNSARPSQETMQSK